MEFLIFLGFLINFKLFKYFFLLFYRETSRLVVCKKPGFTCLLGSRESSTLSMDLCITHSEMTRKKTRRVKMADRNVKKCRKDSVLLAFHGLVDTLMLTARVTRRI